VTNAPEPQALLDWIEKHQSDRSGVTASSIDRNITVSAYVCWRIAEKDAVDTFIRRIGTADLARKILADQIKAELAGIMGQKRLDDLISTDRDKVDRSMEEIHRQLIDGVSERARGYGIDIVDIRLRRTSHPMEVRKTIFDKIKSERATKAQLERDEGDAIARMIRKRADADADRVRNEAIQAKRLREEQGKVEAGDIRFQAYSKDREFAEKLIHMQKMLEALNPSKSVILVSMRDLFWKQMRGPNGSAPPPKGSGSQGSGE
jgi:membrane protease subunit HflC